LNDHPTVSSEHRIIRVLGRGGMGVVYEAEHVRLGRRVALKVLSDESSHDATALARLRREAISMGALQHPHIAQVSDFCEGPPPYLVMELLTGQSLRERLTQRGAMGAADACSIAIQLLSALGAAHRAGIVHRDVKPANVFVVATPLTNVFVKLLDFGVAKLLTPQQGPALTSFDSVIGSAPYMAPEQIRGDAIDGRTDIFALGVTLYEMLAGRRPFVAGPHENVMATILRGGPIAPLAGVPGPLAAIVFRALSPTPSMRFASAEEMSAALLPFASREQLGAIETTAIAIRSPDSRTDTEVDARTTGSATWGTATLAPTLDQTAGLVPYAGPSPSATTAMPRPSKPRSWAGPVIAGVVVVALLVLGGAGVALWFVTSGTLPTTTPPPPPPLVTTAPKPMPIVGSCKGSVTCVEYTAFAMSPDEPAECARGVRTVWREAPCNPTGAVGGCRSVGDSMTVWYFPSARVAPGVCPQGYYAVPVPR
jgi:serine/threonine-protein kinase